MPKEGECIKFQCIYKKIIKSPFIIHANFERILVPQNNGKQNFEELYTNKYKKYGTCSYGYKLVCVDDKFSKTF